MAKRGQTDDPEQAKKAKLEYTAPPSVMKHPSRADQSDQFPDEGGVEGLRSLSPTSKAPNKRRLSLEGESSAKKNCNAVPDRRSMSPTGEKVDPKRISPPCMLEAPVTSSYKEDFELPSSHLNRADPTLIEQVEKSAVQDERRAKVSPVTTSRGDDNSRDDSSDSSSDDSRDKGVGAEVEDDFRWADDPTHRNPSICICKFMKDRIAAGSTPPPLFTSFLVAMVTMMLLTLSRSLMWVAVAFSTFSSIVEPNQAYLSHLLAVVER